MNRKKHLSLFQTYKRKAFCLTICLATFFLMGSNALKVEATQPDETAPDAETMEFISEARRELAVLAEQNPIFGLIYLSDYYDVKSLPDLKSDTVVTVPSGQTVEITDVELVFSADSYEAWSKVKLIHNDQIYEGYIARTNLACADDRFIAWEQMYNMNPSAMTMYAADGTSEDTVTISDGDVVKTYSSDVAAFPASYRDDLQKMKDANPNWTFVPMNTGLDWNTVIANEIDGGKSLIHSSYGDWTKEGSYDNASWYYASEDVLKYFIDPRNALNEENIFQFEQLIYNEGRHNKTALSAFLNTTFMNDQKKAPGTDMTYSTIIWATGVELKVSPYHLAARICQEQGTSSESANKPLICGTYPGYEGLYNYFNVGATGKSNQEYIINGLTHARNKGWTSAYWSIYGGAQTISSNYILKGQDTLYLQKFNVTSNNTYGHQYMQNISAPTSEGKFIRTLYGNANILNTSFVFKIPVYQNMPDTKSPMPTASTNVVLRIPSGYNTTVHLDGVAYTPAKRNGLYIAKAPGSTAKSAVVYQYNSQGVPTSMYVWTLDYKNNAYVTTEQPQMTNLLSYHGFSIRITGKSGIRFKTGISADLRNQFLSGGVNGYTLTEYGTLVMNDANRTNYPMIRGGEKVLSGVSYGLDENSNKVDKIYETVNGRNRFTSVLVGLPPEQYKTEFAFRGYAVLEKDGVQTVIYGPIVAKSIYNLAQQFLDAGIYAEGSDAHTFLNKLITDAK